MSRQRSRPQGRVRVVLSCVSESLDRLEARTIPSREAKNVNRRPRARSRNLEDGTDMQRQFAGRRSYNSLRRAE
jgi:hypothetical protein